MDELIQYCLDELAMSGVQGCSLSELSNFISQYYNTVNTSYPQIVDGRFSNLIWKHLIDCTETRVWALIPSEREGQVGLEGIEGRANSEDVVDSNSSNLQKVQTKFLGEEEKLLRREELGKRYGDENLRLGVNEELIWIALTGTHSRVCCSVLPPLQPGK
ncbi:hypothetical protein BT69DRAFT_181565 [Atractiella rhizophila]|nr:hypothetical protein BT69DRAFT_181565 [Atractiella rhizophila]